MPTFPTLTKNPSYPLDPDGKIEDAILRSNAEGGYEQTRPKFTRVRRNWGVNYIGMSDADVATLRAFEITTIRNGADSFTWTHPVSGTSYTVRLTGPIDYAKSSTGRSTVKFNLREV